MVWLTYLGATVLAKEDGHISMTILEDVFPASKKFLSFLKYIAMIVYCGFVSYFSVAALQVAKMQVSTAMQIPMNIIYLAIPLSMILMILHILLKFIICSERGSLSDHHIS
jgi:C4-dicarboxylate transporter DctQ subunit